jgi:hypothetical protein
MGRLRVLVSASAAILIVLGLLQILVSPADETRLFIPSYTAAGPEALPALGRRLASAAEPAIGDSAADPFLLASVSEPEATGKVRLSPSTTSGTATATAASTVTPLVLPHPVSHNKECVRAWRVRRTSVECARLSAESRACFAGILPAMHSR